MADTQKDEDDELLLMKEYVTLQHIFKIMQFKGEQCEKTRDKYNYIERLLKKAYRMTGRNPFHQKCYYLARRMRQLRKHHFNNLITLETEKKYDLDLNSKNYFKENRDLQTYLNSLIPYLKSYDYRFGSLTNFEKKNQEMRYFLFSTSEVIDLKEQEANLKKEKEYLTLQNNAFRIVNNNITDLFYVEMNDEFREIKNEGIIVDYLEPLIDHYVKFLLDRKKTIQAIEKFFKSKKIRQQIKDDIRNALTKKIMESQPNSTSGGGKRQTQKKQITRKNCNCKKQKRRTIKTNFKII